MEKQRFSLLHLEPGEIYFEDFSCLLISLENKSLSQQGRLKMCSKSLVFDPRNISLPIIKIGLRDCGKIEQFCKISEYQNAISVQTERYIELLASNVIAPYVFKSEHNFLFALNYANVANCLTHIAQLQRAASLPAAEQNAMIATIVHSRHARFKFDPLWMNSIYERILVNVPADKISPLVVNPGRVVLSTDRFYFQPYNNVETYPILKIDLGNIKTIIPRRFLLRHVGLEIDFAGHNHEENHIYLAFRTPDDRKGLYQTLLSQPKVCLDSMEQDVMTLQWQNGVISNYDYLIYLNSIGDRTTNDLTQYPVFPWILTDYTSETIDLSDENIYRDLTKPVGALNSERFKKLQERYEEMSIPKFMYGSHYSAPGLVLFYLVRKYPHYMLCLQNGRFDHPDRMFNSVAGVFKNCMTNMSDFKELLPEFYDVGQKGSFLVNQQGISFGYQSDGNKVGNVKLPNWAKDPEHFIQILRDGLESEYVSNNLHHWIDLIFGYKQRGEQAEKANNLFYYLCYEGAINLDLIKDVNERHAMEVQIMEFGQIPKQVFTVPHPQRRTRSISLPLNFAAGRELEESRHTNIKGMQLLTSLPAHKIKIGSIIVSNDNDTIISVGHDSTLKMYSLAQNKLIRSFTIGQMVLSSCVQLQNKQIVIIGCWDDTIIFYDTTYGRVCASLRAHEDAVSVLAWSGNETGLLATGSWDCTVHIWKGFSDIEQKPPKPIQNLVAELEHESQVTCLAFSPDNQYLASGTLEGEVGLWSVDNHLLAHRLPSHSGSVTAVNFSPEGHKFISCGEDGVFRLIDLMTRMVVFERRLPEKLLCLSWDGVVLVLGTDCNVLYVWDMIEVKLIATVNAHQGPILCITKCSANDLYITGGQDSTIKVWKCDKM